MTDLKRITFMGILSLPSFNCRQVMVEIDVIIGLAHNLMFKVYFSSSIFLCSWNYNYICVKVRTDCLLYYLCVGRWCFRILRRGLRCPWHTWCPWNRRKYMHKYVNWWFHCLKYIGNICHPNARIYWKYSTISL